MYAEKTVSLGYLVDGMPYQSRIDRVLVDMLYLIEGVKHSGSLADNFMLLRLFWSIAVSAHEELCEMSAMHLRHKLSPANLPKGGAEFMFVRTAESL